MTEPSAPPGHRPFPRRAGALPGATALVPLLAGPALAAPPAAGTPPATPYLLLPLLLGAVLLAGFRSFYPNCRPDQILVIAGRRQRRRDGQETGYRVIQGGRALALPVLEQRSWMDVRTRPVAVHVEEAYAAGGTPIDVEAIATEIGRAHV